MLDYCIQKASELPYQRHRSRHYCVIVDKRGKIVAEGANDYRKTSPRFAMAARKVGLPEKQCLHSEAVALFRDKRKRGVKLSVARVLSNGELGNSRPCRVCEYLIKEHGGIYSTEYTL